MSLACRVDSRHNVNSSDQPPRRAAGLRVTSPYMSARQGYSPTELVELDGDREQRGNGAAAPYEFEYSIRHLPAPLVHTCECDASCCSSQRSNEDRVAHEEPSPHERCPFNRKRQALKGGKQ